MIDLLAQIDTEQLAISPLAIGPEIILALGAALVLMLDVTLKPSHRLHALAAGSSLFIAGLLAVRQWAELASGPALSFHYSRMIILDRPSVVVRLIIIVATALALAAGWGMVRRLGRRGAEAVALILLAAVGFMIMGASTNLMMIFLGLEIGSISLYVLAGITRTEVKADEAAMKYFLLGSFASAIFVYGVALTYAASGSIELFGIAGFLQNVVLTRPGVALIGLGLLIIGLLFKVTAAPFHAWAPDVYQGAPAGVVGFMAAVAKVGAFAALIRIVSFFPFFATTQSLLAGIAALSVVFGTVMAIQQDDARRLLAYSGVGHAGFIIIGVASGPGGFDETLFYLVAYSIMLVTGFAIVAAVSGPAASGSPMSAFRGLARTNPGLAAAMVVVLLSMAGMPVTSGFVAKFGVFAAGWAAELEWLVIVGLLASVAAFFFYLRIVVDMYMREPELVEAPGTPPARPEIGPAQAWSIGVGVVLTIVLGVWPAPVLELVANAFS